MVSRRHRSHVTPPSRRLSRGRLALARVGGTPTQTAGQTGVSRTPDVGVLGWERPALHLSGRALLAIAMLLCAGCKKKESPSSQSGGKKSAIIATQSAPGSAFIMSLTMDPAQPKFGRKTKFRVTVRQPTGTPVEGARVEISLVMPLMDMGKNQFLLKSGGNGLYEGTGEFSMAGEWEVVVTANAEGKTGKTTFNVKVAE